MSEENQKNQNNQSSAPLSTGSRTLSAHQDRRWHRPARSCRLACSLILPLMSPRDHKREAPQFPGEEESGNTAAVEEDIRCFVIKLPPPVGADESRVNVFVDRSIAADSVIVGR